MRLWTFSGAIRQQGLQQKGVNNKNQSVRKFRHGCVMTNKRDGPDAERYLQERSADVVELRYEGGGGGRRSKLEEDFPVGVMTGGHDCKELNSERREKATVAKNKLRVMSGTCWLYRQAVWSLHQPDNAGLRGTQRPPATRAIAQLLTDFKGEV
jgi:hypothetical protein